jgi:hypothetical protein
MATILRASITGSVLAILVVARAAFAAPALKKPDPKDQSVANLTALHALIENAIKDGKWPSDADERRALDAVRILHNSTHKQIELTPEKLPVEVAQTEKADIAKEFKKGNCERLFVLAGDVQGTAARNSIIFAAGQVKFTVIENCIVVGEAVQFTTMKNSIIIASKYVRGTGIIKSDHPKAKAVIVSGQWLRVTSASGAICHILRPGSDPAPDDPKGLANPIRMTGAREVCFLNRPEDVKTTSSTDCRFIELKAPLAK